MMSKKRNMTCSVGFGVVLLIIGIIIIAMRLRDVLLTNILRSELCLLNGTLNYDIWKSVDLEFKVYLFHVVNPEEVQKNGDVPTVVEYGPYVYDDHLERIIIGVDESADTIDYVARRTIVFNATKSGNYSEDDEITVLNIAYLGSILAINEKFSAFLSTIGSNIPLLFPDSKSIFVRGKVKDILFDGLPLICDVTVHPELTLICNVIKAQAPPIIRAIDLDAGIYAYSLMNTKNRTYDGPYTISRGVKDYTTVGEISKFKGSQYANNWSVENCSIVKGTDSIFYPAFDSRKSVLFIFASDACRSIPIEYSGNRVYNGLLGYHYKTVENLWNNSDSFCYCPRAADNSLMCPIQGSLVLDKCQEAPVIMTEPHFLHGSSGLSSMVNGLHPDEEKHSAYVVVEPLTGSPLSGARRLQLNMLLQPLPVDLLSNVSRGFIPIVWVDEGLTPGVKILAPIILVHRARNVLGFLIWIPFFLGATLVMYSFWINGVTKISHRTSGRVTILATKNTLN